MEDTNTEQLPDLETATIEIPGRGVIQSNEEPPQTEASTTDDNEEITSEDQPQEEAKVLENEDQPKEEPKAEEPKEEEPKSEDKEDAPLEDEQYFQTLSEQVDLEVKSDEDIVRYLKENTELKKQLEEAKSKDPLDEYDPIVKDIAKATAANMDVNTYLRARTLDVEKLDGKDALFEKYKLDNTEAFKRNPDFATKRFEKEFASKYNELNKTLNEEDFEDHSEYLEAKEKLEEEQEFIKQSLEDDVAVAKQGLSEWQKENTTIPEQSGGLSEEDYAKKVEAYNSSVDTVMQDLNNVEIPVGDQSLKFELDEAAKKFVDEGLRHPEKTLKEVIGIDLENGSVDPQSMANLLTLKAVMENQKLGETIKKFALETYNKETLEAKEANPKQVDGLNSAPEEKDFWDQIGDAFASQRRY